MTGMGYDETMFDTLLALHDVISSFTLGPERIVYTIYAWQG